MRVGLAFLAVALAAPVPAMAAGFVIPEQPPVHFDAYDSPVIAHPWINQRPDARLEDKPVGELLATKIGLVNGSAELFRFRVEDGPSEKTMLNGAIDGGGIKLKLTW